MKETNPMKFKAIIKKEAFKKNISAQLVMQNYMLERLLIRISLSKYQKNFIIKGGFLISLIVGLDTRATMDLDTTVKGFSLLRDSIYNIFSEIISIQIDDNVKFELMNISDIREGDEYPGYRVNLKANYAKISVPLSVDVTTGDVITPNEIEYTFSSMFNDYSINLLGYNLETILAEKIETVLARGITNTRPRDYYDIHVLYTLYANKLNDKILLESLKRITKKRNSTKILEMYNEIIIDIKSSQELKKIWDKYQKNYDYAKQISFKDVCDTLRKIMNIILKDD